MPRRSILALCLLGLALAFSVAGRSALADDAKADAAHATASSEHAPAAGHDAAAPGGAHAQPNILEPQPTLAIWTLVVFLCLLAVLRTFAWKPLIQALNSREEHFEHVLLDTEKARNESERLLEEHRRQMALARDEVAALIAEGRRDATMTAEAIIKKAQSEAEASEARARREIESARDQALGEIWDKTADLAVAVAGKVLQTNLGDDEHRRMVEAAMNELPKVNGSRV